jgi:hypothetical protein
VSGYVVLLGRRLPVMEMRLAHGRICLSCSIRGPVPAYDGTIPVTVFGEDGIGVCQGDCAFSWPEAGPHDTFILNVEMCMNRCFGDAEAIA